MKKGIRFRLEQLSIHRKMYLTVCVSVLLFMVFFGIIFSVMFNDLQEAAVDQHEQILSLICTDLDNFLGTTENYAVSLVTNETIKKYVSSNSTSEDKYTLMSMMSRNVFVSFKTPDNIGVLDFMVIRNAEDYVRSVTSRVRNQEIYDQLAEYICSNYVPGQTYLTLPADLHQALNCYCYILPLADIANSELEVGGYLVLFMNDYSFAKTLVKYYDADTTIFIVDSQHNILFNNNAEQMPNTAVLLETAKNSQKATAKINGKNTLVLTHRLDSMDWDIVMCTPTSVITEQLQKYWVLFFASLFLLAGITVLLISLISRSITNRIKEMVKVITSIREGDIDCRYPVVYQDEISFIGSEFNRMIDQIQKYHLNVAMHELRRKEAELNALQSSINPHFLYNSLDCIRASALVNNDMRVAHQIQILANMFRYTTGSNSMRGDTVTVEAEMNHVYDYLSMINFRFEDRYAVDVNIDQAVLPIQIPKLILQPIVENSFHHGMRSIATGGRINISGRIDKDRECVVLSVVDNGVGISPERLAQVQKLLNENPLSVSDTPYRALVNINDRIRIACGREYGVSLESTPGEGTRTEICLPITN